MDRMDTFLWVYDCLWNRSTVNLRMKIINEKYIYHPNVYCSNWSSWNIEDFTEKRCIIISNGMNNEIRNIIRNSLPTPKNRGCAVMLSGVIHRLLGACFPEKSYYYKYILFMWWFHIKWCIPTRGMGGGGASSSTSLTITTPMLCLKITDSLHLTNQS